MAQNTRSQDRKQKEELEGDENQWKFRAPYKIQDADSFKSRFEGGCHCGKVQFHINQTEPLDAKYCHCTTCQALHGGHLRLDNLNSADNFKVHLLGGQLRLKRKI
jgi:hypothetical protein